MSSLQAHEQKNLKRNGNKAIKHAFQSKLFLKEDRYEYEGTLTNEYTIQEEVNKDEKDFSDFKEKDLRIQDSEAEVL